MTTLDEQITYLKLVYIRDNYEPVAKVAAAQTVVACQLSQ